MRWGIWAALLLGGCATVIEGTTQTIRVDVVSDTGSCEITRQGELVGRSVPGQQGILVGKSYYDPVFACSAPGYTPRTETMASALSAYTVGSFLLVDFGIVDSLSGAWMKYPTKITVLLSKAPRA